MTKSHSRITNVLVGPIPKNIFVRTFSCPRNLDFEKYKKYEKYKNGYVFEISDFFLVFPNSFIRSMYGTVFLFLQLQAIRKLQHRHAFRHFRFRQPYMIDVIFGDRNDGDIFGALAGPSFKISADLCQNLEILA